MLLVDFVKLRLLRLALIECEEPITEDFFCKLCILLFVDVICVARLLDAPAV